MTYLEVIPGRIIGTKTVDTDSNWTPRADIREGKDAYTIEFDLPGLDKGDFNVEVHERTLTVKGERKRAVTNSDEKFYRYLERPVGKFYRSFRLPDNIDENKMIANYKNGILNLELYKKEEAQPRSIEIK